MAGYSAATASARTPPKDSPRTYTGRLGGQLLSSCFRNSLPAVSHYGQHKSGSIAKSTGIRRGAAELLLGDVRRQQAVPSLAVVFPGFVGHTFDQEA
jgi:hypothetical protein